MAIARRVFGPFAPEEVSPGTPGHELRWSFIGIRGDLTVAHWTLIFKPDTRSFVVSASQHGSSWRGRAMQEAQKTLPKGYPASPAHPNAFLDGRPVEEGRIVDILKRRLGPAEVARCTAAALAAVR